MHTVVQIREFQPKLVAIRDASKVAELKEAIRGVERQPEILVGDEGAIEVARHPEIDAVVTGIVGEPRCSCEHGLTEHWFGERSGRGVVNVCNSEHKAPQEKGSVPVC